MERVKLCKVAKDSSEEGEAFTEENVGLFFPSVKLLNNLNTKFKMRNIHAIQNLSIACHLNFNSDSVETI